MFVSLLGCKQNTSNKEVVSEITEEVKEANLQNIDENQCANKDSLVETVKLFIETLDFELIDNQIFKNQLVKNDKSKFKCYFPNNKEESDLFYGFVSKLEEASATTNKAISMLIHLNLVTTKNVELKEYLLHLMPKIAVVNTVGFINVLDELESTNQSKIIGSFEYVKDVSIYDTLLEKLKAIKDETVQNTVTVVVDKINKEIERISTESNQ